ncbi:hypothetical protein MTR_8g005560 [Medicago truncatula]|uniref:Uncharacterized protein n=1 Tax=Medicago truncatula TaxID=3880 RepID=G7LAP7_MEDTR|nr:hypothetical protein MTR_8g005560 [Medicago truncatula]
MPFDHVDFCSDSKVIVDDFHHNRVDVSETDHILTACRQLFTTHFTNSKGLFVSRESGGMEAYGMKSFLGCGGVSFEAFSSGKKGVENDGEVALDPLTLATDDQLCEMDRLRTDAAVTSTIFSCASIDHIYSNSRGLDAGSSNNIE